MSAAASRTLHVERLDEPTRARVTASDEARNALRLTCINFVRSIRTELVIRHGEWNGETRTIVRYLRTQERVGQLAVGALSGLPDAEIAHTPGRVAVVRASDRIRCGCRGILPHTRDRNSGCPPDWSAVRLLPRRDAAAGGAYYNPRAEPRPLEWECAACGSFARDIPLRAGLERVQADYEDHVANRCPGAGSPIAWKVGAR